MSKAFDTLNIHTLIRKLLQTKKTGTIIRLIANYIKGRKAYTTYINHTSLQRQFKTGVPQGGVLSLTLFNIYTADIPPHRSPVHVMASADDITITSTHTSTSASKNYIQPYQHKVYAWEKQSTLTLDPGKTTCTLFTPDPAEYNSNLDLKINNTALPMATNTKVLGITLYPKLAYNTHIHNISIRFQRLPPARDGTAQRKIFHLASWSQLIHPGPSSSRLITLTHYSTEPLTTGPDFNPLLLLLALAGDVHPNLGPPRYPYLVCLKNVTSQCTIHLCTRCSHWVYSICSGLRNIVDYRRANGWICTTCRMPPQPHAPSPPPSPAHTSTMSDKTFNILQWNANGIDNKQTEHVYSRRTTSKWWPFRSPISRHN